MINGCSYWQTIQNYCESERKTKMKSKAEIKNPQQTLHLVELVNNEPRVGTFAMSKGFETEHRQLTKLITKFKNDFESLGVLVLIVHLPTSKNGGRPVKEYQLNEKQTYYMAKLLPNNAKVRQFNLILINEFIRIRDAYAESLILKSSMDWQIARKNGKSVRRMETDTIKLFIDYAISQGSQSADKYYAIITKAQNSALFILTEKYKNVREMLTTNQLINLSTADDIVAKYLKIGMDRKLHYKECYKLAKEKLEAYADIVGASPISLIAVAPKPVLPAAAPALPAPAKTKKPAPEEVEM